MPSDPRGRVLPATASQSANPRHFPKTVRRAVMTAIADPEQAAVDRVMAASAGRFKAAAVTKGIAATLLRGLKKRARKKECA